MAEPVRVAVVTGANRGLGLETCRQLGRGGMTVVLCARDAAKGRAAAEALAGEAISVVPAVLDVTDPAAITVLAERVARELGRVDVLVNNAGIFLDAETDEREGQTEGLGSASVFEAKVETLRANMDVHVYGPLLLAQAFVPMMRAQGYGRIVNVSSGSGQLHDMPGGQPGYRISKAGLTALTRILAAELAGGNILANAVCPGWVRTDMGGPDAERTVEEGVDTICWLARLPEGGPSGLLFRDREPVPW